MVVALVALFSSLGGVSYGVATGFIDSREIKNNVISTKDLKNNDVRGKDVRTNTLRGSDIVESSLGKVPSAGSADSATNATNATNATSLGGSAASAYATKTGTEAVRLVGTAGNPAFNTGWGNAGSPFQVVGFWKDQFGIVHLQGDASRSSGTNPDIFQLPVGYRPNAYENIAVYGDGGTAAGIAITGPGDGTPGAVRLVGGAATFIGLSGVTFRP
jgi:hypothetical protein